jgi:3-oxoadipate enol-lactonase
MNTRTVPVRDVELVIAEDGNGGRPLLLLHGFTGAKEDFTEWVEPLGALGWHAVAPDHRGHGASSHPEADEAYSIEILAHDALALADVLEWDRFTLLGHSMGGFVAQVMAIAAPGRLDGLVLMDTSHGPIEGIDTSQAGVAVSVVRDVGMDGMADFLAARDPLLDTPANRRLIEERPGYAEFGDRKFRATSPYLYAAMLSELVNQDDKLAELATLPASLRTLVIVGDQDAPFLGPSKRMADTIPNTRLAVIGEAGHSPQFENTAEWWAALSTFLAEIASTSP